MDGVVYRILGKEGTQYLNILPKAGGDVECAKKYWQALTRWENYLANMGFDLGNQLCTDDFAGHLARNANLPVKDIVALGSYGYIANQLGDNNIGDKILGLKLFPKCL